MRDLFSKTKILLVVIALFTACLCFGQKQGPLTFVQMCDTQLGMGGYDHDMNTFEKAVTKINTLATL
jgi:serine/threonine-protein phosphatase CPPED1